MADVPRVKPSVVAEGCNGCVRIIPIPKHNHLAAHEDFTIIGNFGTDTTRRRTDGMELNVARNIRTDYG